MYNDVKRTYSWEITRSCQVTLNSQQFPACLLQKNSPPFLPFLGALVPLSDLSVLTASSRQAAMKYRSGNAKATKTEEVQPIKCDCRSSILASTWRGNPWTTQLMCNKLCIYDHWMIIDVQGKSSVFIGDFPLPCRNHGTFPFWNQCCAIFPNVFEAQNLLSCYQSLQRKISHESRPVLVGGSTSTQRYGFEKGRSCATKSTNLTFCKG